MRPKTPGPSNKRPAAWPAGDPGHGRSMQTPPSRDESMSSGGAGHEPVPTLPVGHVVPVVHMAGQGSHDTTPRDPSSGRSADPLAPAAWLGPCLSQPPEPAGPPPSKFKQDPVMPKVKPPPAGFQQQQQWSPPPPARPVQYKAPPPGFQLQPPPPPPPPPPQLPAAQQRPSTPPKAPDRGQPPSAPPVFAPLAKAPAGQESPGGAGHAGVIGRAGAPYTGRESYTDPRGLGLPRTTRPAPSAAQAAAAEVEYSWNTYGIPMEYSWNTYGIPMEYPWNSSTQAEAEVAHVPPATPEFPQAAAAAEIGHVPPATPEFPQAAAPAVGHVPPATPAHADPHRPTPEFPHGWYGGSFQAPQFIGLPRSCELRGGGELGVWTVVGEERIQRRPERSYRKGPGGTGYRLFIGGLGPGVTDSDFEKWVRAAGGESHDLPMIEYSGVTGQRPLTKVELCSCFMCVLFAMMYAFTSSGTRTSMSTTRSGPGPVMASAT